MAALFRKLTAKYPESIKVEVDDEMKMYEQMMKDAKKDKKGDENGEDGDDVGGDTVNMDDEF